MTNTEQIRTKKISFILALSVIIFAAIATYFTLCHDINIMRITTPVILGLAMSIILCGVLQKFFYNWLTKNPIHFSFGEQSSPIIESESTTEPVCIAETPPTEQLADSSEQEYAPTLIYKDNGIFSVANFYLLKKSPYPNLLIQYSISEEYHIAIFHQD